MNHTTVIGPEAMESQNKFLERHRTYSLVGRDDSMLSSKYHAKLARMLFSCQGTGPLDQSLMDKARSKHLIAAEYPHGCGKFLTGLSHLGKSHPVRDSENAQTQGLM